MVIIWKCLKCGALLPCSDDECHIAIACKECGAPKEDMELIEED